MDDPVARLAKQEQDRLDQQQYREAEGLRQKLVAFLGEELAGYLDVRVENGALRLSYQGKTYVVMWSAGFRCFILENLRLQNTFSSAAELSRLLYKPPKRW